MKKCSGTLFMLFFILAFACASFAATIKKVDEPAVKLEPGQAATKPVDNTNKAQNSQQLKNKKAPTAKPNAAAKEKAGSWDWGNKK